MTKKRIAVIGLKGLPAFGGAAEVGQSIIKELHNDYSFTVYATSSHTNLKSGKYENYELVVFRKIFNNGLNVLYYYFASTLHALFLRKFSFIHLHHSTAAFIILLLRVKYKVMSTSHGIRSDNKWKYLKPYLSLQGKILLKYSALTTCVSKVEYEFYKDKYPNIYYIPNGIHKPEIGQMPDYMAKNYILFAAGRIIPIKGCHVLLKALKKIKYKGELIIIGNLDQIKSYKKEILKLSKNLNVSFKGLIKDKNVLNSYILNSELFVFPSSNEMMSMMLLEVARLQVPIICSNIPENKVIFNDSEVLYFKTDDDKDLSEKIRFALDNKSRMKKYGEKAKSKITSTYSWTEISKDYANLYERILTNK
jgi:glycosyltransferase involved in cell wall biosynthesis